MGFSSKFWDPGRNYFLKNNLSLIKYLIIRYERPMYIGVCYILTFLLMIEAPTVLLLDGTKGRLEEIFSKWNLGEFVKEKGKRNVGIGQACALISHLSFSVWTLEILISKVSNLFLALGWHSWM